MIKLNEVVTLLLHVFMVASLFSVFADIIFFVNGRSVFVVFFVLVCSNSMISFSFLSIIKKKKYGYYGVVIFCMIKSLTFGYNGQLDAAVFSFLVILVIFILLRVGDKPIYPTLR